MTKSPTNPSCPPAGVPPTSAGPPSLVSNLLIYRSSIDRIAALGWNGPLTPEGKPAPIQSAGFAFPYVAPDKDE